MFKKYDDMNSQSVIQNSLLPYRIFSINYILVYFLWNCFQMLLFVSEVSIAPYGRGESWKHYVVETKCFATHSLFLSFARMQIKKIVFV